MIVSASRRTDIPAYFGEWLMRRIRAGYCEVANPFNPSRIRRVELDPASVDCFVFWTRHPKSLYPYLIELDRRGFSFYFTWTVLDYPRYFEPQLPALETRARLFERVSERLGPHRVVWRYDPIVFTDVTGPEFHLRAFERLAVRLAPFTDSVVVSIYDHYRKLDSRMADLARRGAGLTGFENDPESLRSFMRELAAVAASHGLAIRSCAEDHDLAGTGITEGACIDGERIAHVTGRKAELPKDPGQRTRCNCVASVDIGAYDTCPAGCVYCYATGRRERISARMRSHDPGSPQLVEERTVRAAGVGSRPPGGS